MLLLSWRASFRRRDVNPTGKARKWLKFGIVWGNFSALATWMYTYSSG